MLHANLLDPVSIGIVLVGTIVATTMRCGLADTALAGRALASLMRRPFDVSQAKAGLARQVRDIASDGLLRAEPHHFGDGEFDYLTDLLISQRSIDALVDEHEKFKQRRADVAQRAIAVLEVAVEMGPVMGLAGTLVALALQTGDPQGSLVAAVGMAVLTTLYGLIVANFVFAPLAAAISRRSMREEAERETVLRWLSLGLKSACNRPGGDLARSRATG